MREIEPLVSVVIPTYNREAYLREAVASVFAQTYTRWELIVADDGSTDGTRAYLASLTDPRVRAVRCEHSGVPARVRNAGIAVAKGDYVAFLDDDDLWRPEKLQLQIADLRAHPERRWSYTDCARIDAQGAPVTLPPGREWRPHEGWILPSVVRLEAWPAMPALVVERAALQEVGGFDDALPLCEDYDLYLKLARRWQASVVDRPLAVIRYHRANTTGGRIEAAAQMAELYRRLAAEEAARDVRRAARDQYAAMSVDLADRLRAAGRWSASLGTLARVLAGQPAYARAWLALFRLCVRPLVPAFALGLRRSRHERAAAAAELARARAEIPDVPLTLAVELPVLGVPLRFESNDAEALALVEEAFGAWRSLDAGLVTEPAARLKLVVTDGDEGGAAHAAASYAQLAGDGHVLRTAGSVGFVDGPGREAAARLTRALLADRWHTRYVWIEGLTLTLISAKNRFPVHAAAVARGETALLLAGKPGAGKSTLAYQAHRAGLRVLSDDAAYLQVEPELRVWGMPGRVDLVTAARGHFPELAGRAPSLRANGEEKIAVELGGAWPASGAAPPVASRAGVVLLEREGGGPARLARAGADEVRASLKAGLGISARRFGKELDRALDLVARGGGWRLTLSDDPTEAAPLLDTVLDQVDQSARQE